MLTSKIYIIVSRNKDIPRGPYHTRLAPRAPRQSSRRSGCTWRDVRRGAGDGAPVPGTRARARRLEAGGRWGRLFAKLARRARRLRAKVFAALSLHLLHVNCALCIEENNASKTKRVISVLR